MHAISLPSLFDGLCVTDRAASEGGMVANEMSLGSGRLWDIQAPPQRVSSDPFAPAGSCAGSFKILFQLTGSARVTQAGRTADLRESMFAFIDGAQPFSVEMAQAHRQLLFQLPRPAIVARFRGIERRTALAQGDGESGDALLRDFALSLAGRADALSPQAGACALTALLELLGAACASRGTNPAATRVAHARAVIELDLVNEQLSPDGLADRMGISRRYLDALFKQGGSTVSAYIRERRLQRAAALLRDPAHRGASVSEVCFGAGFQDAAHFARAFRGRFGVAPSVYRRGY